MTSLKVSLVKVAPLFFALSVVTAVFADDTYQHVTLKGKWLVEKSGEGMLDPQTSALTLWRGKLLSLSDRSAHLSQQKQIHIIDADHGVVAETSLKMVMSANVKNSCFAKYLAGKPDFEALVVDPNNDRNFIVATEDAYQEKLSPACQQRFGNTGSTDYPSLLVQLTLNDNNTLLMTHVRPLKFNASFNVGNFSNDGIEAMAFGQNNVLYLGLEKDSKSSARIFSLQVRKDFWQSDDFIQVLDTQVMLPEFKKGQHPINGMDYLHVKGHLGYLVAAARNDDQLWIIDLAKQKPTKIIAMSFLAPIKEGSEQCIGNIDNKNDSVQGWELIRNTSLEGVAIDNDRIWLINDPWKAHYLDNVKCLSNQDNYKRMTPLIFSLPIADGWTN
jgi:hypothetical protein